MIINNTIEIKCSRHNLKIYNDLGYLDIKIGDFFNIKTVELTKYAKNKIICKCDNPNCKLKQEKEVSWRSYYNSTNGLTSEYYCIKCIYIKTSKTNIERYGVPSPLQNKEILNKVQTTNEKIYGNVCSLHGKEQKVKVTITNNERYGKDYASQSDDIKVKTKKTNNEIYGKDHPMQNTEVKEKTKKTIQKKYNVDNVFQHEGTKIKIRKTIEKKYGVSYSSQVEEFKQKSINTQNKIYGDIYSRSVYKNKQKIKNPKFKEFGYDVIDYKDGSLYTLKSPICNHIFDINNDNFNGRIINFENCCTVCFPISLNTSISEIEIENYVKTLNIETLKDRYILSGKELDIYIPEYNLAIEFNGLYYHSEKYKEKEYHLNKSLICQKKGIFLMHIWEDEWKFKRDIVKSIISNRLGKIDNKIYARKCEIKEVKDSKLVRKFLDENHIQGYSQSSIKLGLYYDNELVSLMTFGYRHTNTKKEFELIRFCNKLNTNVIGASSKLFKYFLNNYDYTDILSYSDFRLFDGKMYETLGFEKIHLSKPDYFWCKDIKRYHRFNYNKKKLVKEGYDPNKTEVEIMHERGYYRVWSCGQIRWVFKK